MCVCVCVHSVMCSDVSRMTDSERDQIDQDAQIFMRTCADAIGQLRSDSMCVLLYISMHCIISHVHLFL